MIFSKPPGRLRLWEAFEYKLQNDMKKFLLMTALLVVALSCGKQPQPQPAPVAISDSYVGTVTVVYQEENVENENITVDVTAGEAEGTMDIQIYKIKFVPQMPVTIDVLLPGIPYERNEDGSIAFEADGFDPYSMGGPVARYHVTGLNGTIRDGKLDFSLLFGTYPTSFSGTVIE